MQGKGAAALAADLFAGVVCLEQQWELAAAVKLLADRLLGQCAAPDLMQVRSACATLNARRQFELCRVLAQAWQDSSPPDLTIMKHQIQALINLALLDSAQAELEAAARLLPAMAPSATRQKEQMELEGLAARVQKQRFVDSADANWLEAAYRSYWRVYHEQPSQPFWHGVNAVALLARAEREGLSFGDEPAASLAARLYAAVLRKESDDPWRLASLSELCLAQELCDSAELWLYRFLHAPKCTPFMVDSYERQLREIWQGQALQGGLLCADRLATIVARYQLARFSTLSISPARARALPSADLEKVFSDAGSFSVGMVKRMLEACHSIGCVSNSVGARLGTGFMLDGADLGGAASDKLFVTNAHVLSDSVDGAIPVMEGRVSFELAPDAQNMPQFYQVEQLVYTSAPGPLGVSHPASDLLDVTIVKLKGVPDGVKGLQVARAIPLIDGKAKAYVIGHPRGSGLQVSVHDSELLACDGHERLLHYRTPTDPGSSGSPVFNEHWQIIALHHGGSHAMPRLNPATGVYQANEGVTLAAIKAGIAAGRSQPGVAADGAPARA